VLFTIELSIFIFSQFIFTVANIFGLLFPTDYVGYATILAKHVLGYNLGDFLTNSSGHPAKPLLRFRARKKEIFCNVKKFAKQKNNQTSRFVFALQVLFQLPPVH
jgi:translation elongation factor EF-4